MIPSRAERAQPAGPPGNAEPQLGESWFAAARPKPTKEPEMPKEIDKDLVRHIGVLSRIELTERQVEVFSPQLAGILGHFDKLQQLDTEQVEPLVHPVEIHNVLADDEPGPSLAPQQALANAPARDGDFFMVPKLIGDSQ